ncbi:Versicolorin B desaturase [Cytospora mali]|uniref:Versicolorin B desaturase n=1 Tax=Cytospora mali TaxID=578113 RepID=A0A194VBJ8_CYTMA|nr:Versicolorin B desaturase [Valsa mali var. pyri (nom. inval.)]
MTIMNILYGSHTTLNHFSQHRTNTNILKLVYRIVYLALNHPFTKYPGPVLAKFTNLYGAYHAWKGDIHLDMHRCHLKYGDRVRYAPDRILINTPQALHDIYGHGAPVRKFPGYQALSSHAANTLTMSDKVQHALRRRVLSQAFSESSLRMLEPAIRSRVDRFCQFIRDQRAPEEKWTTPLDMARRFTDLAFDLMTAVTFDMDYDTIQEPRFRYVVEVIEASNIRLGVLLQASGLSFRGLDKLLFPGSAKSAARFVKFLRRLLHERLQREKTDGRDIFSFLQRCKDPDTGNGLSPRDISSETATFIVAGSDTTSTTLASLAHYLTGSSRCYRRAAEEVRTTFASVDEIHFGPKLNSCVFLRACLDEAMRITPPGGASLWREVEHQGAVIDGDFVPAGYEVGCSIYAMHRSPKNWEDADRFLPERWIERSRMTVGQRQPYFPFNIGPRSCVGKPLALAEVMLTFARLLWEFDFRRAHDDEMWWEAGDVDPAEYVLKDHVTGQKEGPLLCFRPRIC